MAELATDPAERAEWLTFVVIGAGPTGVELVGQVAELAHKVLPRDYRTVNTHGGPDPARWRGRARCSPPVQPEKLQRVHPATSWSRWASRCGSTRWPSTWTTRASPSRARTAWRRSAPARGSGRPGVQASPLAKLLAEKAGAGGRPGGPHPGAARLHARRASRGVRDRRHGGAEQAARGGAARHAGGQVRREADRRRGFRATRRPSRSSTSTKATWPRSGTGPRSPTRSA